MSHVTHPRPLAPLWSSLTDFAAAGLTALAISPIVCLIDQSIASRVATGRPILAYAAHILRCPHTYAKNLLTSPAGRWVWTVYFATFASANIVDSTLARQHRSAVDNSRAGLSKFVTVTVVSTAATILKDVRLAHCFTRAGNKPMSVPAQSVALFAARDAVTIFSSFILPPLVARRVSSTVETEARRLKAAQLMLPMAFQIFTTPIHLAGYHLHHDRVRRGVTARWRQVRRDMGTAVPVRMLRILPAMGVGNVLNSELRASLQERVESLREQDRTRMLDGV